MTAGRPAAALSALYFDGRSARGTPVRLHVEDGRLHATPEDGSAGPPPWPLKAVRWPERTRHGQRVLHLADGGSLQCADSAAFDAWRQQHGVAEGWVVRAQQNWRSVAVALLAMVLVATAGYRWGVPWAAQGLVAVLPAQVDSAIGEAVLDRFRNEWLKPSRLSPQRHQELREAFAALLARSRMAPPPYRIHFHDGGTALGPNALALPGGDIVVTDALVLLLTGHDDTLLGVLAHELGHVELRHGMRALAQALLVGTAVSVAFGDFSNLVVGATALLSQLDYSRAAEREADAHAAQVLRAGGVSPAVMVVLFEKLRALQGADEGPAVPLALASHPLDEERVRFYKEAAAAR